MNQFQSVAPSEFNSVFDQIGKDRMLISATDGNRPNTMTASWGGIGYLWNRPVAICYIRPQRYTYGLVEQSEQLTLSFLPKEFKSALSYCGSHSGRDGDKFSASGLTCSHTADGVPFPSEAHTVLVCKKLYADDLREDSFLPAAGELLPKYYGDKDFHRFYICEICDVLIKK